MNNYFDTEVLNYMKMLGTGWNLGNTFDAFDDLFNGNELDMECSWTGVRTTDKLIQAIAGAGFQSIRIPVSWHNHVDKEFEINDVWLRRVEEVVHWAFKANLFVILNCHHDTCEDYCYPSVERFDQSQKYISKIWKQIAEHFREYDERLIFEGMNEPRLKGTEYEWNFDPENQLCREAMECINGLNQVFVDCVRKTGGRNINRYLMVPAYAAKPDVAAFEFFTLPNDIVSNRVIVSAHAYSPYSFCLERPGINQFATDDEKLTGEIDAVFACLNERFIKNGIPVIMGEFGCQDKHNTEDRVRCVSYYIGKAKEVGIPCCIWDNSYFEKGDEFFGLINRESAEWVFPEIVHAIV